MKQHLKAIKQHLRKNWGSKCPDFNAWCDLCKVWMAYEIIEDAVSAYERLEKRIDKHKNTA